MVVTDLSGNRRLVYNLLVAVLTIHLEDTIIYSNYLRVSLPTQEQGLLLITSTSDGGGKISRVSSAYSPQIYRVHRPRAGTWYLVNVKRETKSHTGSSKKLKEILRLRINLLFLAPESLAKHVSHTSKLF